MLGFDVEINGERACVAAEDEAGMVFASVGFQGKALCGEACGSGASGYASIMGVSGDPKTGMVTKNWLQREGLKPGDEIRIRLVEVEECDEPAETTPAKVSFWTRLRYLFR